MDAEATCTAYDVVTEVEEPCPHWSGWILGEKFTLPNDDEKFAARLRSCLWFSYRKNFKQIASTGYTSDSGWGCTMRCGQMLLAEALSRIHLPAGWMWKEGLTDSNYNEMLRQFVDIPESLYSIQQIAQSGVDYGRKVGDWFGPNTMCQVIKSLSAYDSWSRLAVHVAMDLTVVEEEVRNAAMAEPVFLGSNSVPAHARPPSGSSPDGQAASSKDASSSSSSPPRAACAAAGSPGAESCFRPTLLLIPLRLGLDSFEARYTQPLLACFSLPQSVGFIGGKPRHALWFVGHRDNRLVYLDPHTTQGTLQLTSRQVPDSTYHNSGAGRMRVVDLDPSVAVGFFCKTEEELTDLFSRLRKDICSITPAMFEVQEKRHCGLDMLSMESFDDFSLTADDGTQEESTCVDDPRQSKGSAGRSPDVPEYDDYDIVGTDEVTHAAAMELVGTVQDQPSEVPIATVQQDELFSLLA